MTLENFIYESVSEILNGKYDEVKESIEKPKVSGLFCAIFHALHFFFIDN